MIEFVLASVISLSFCGFVYLKKVKSDKVMSNLTGVWEENLLSFVKSNGLTGVDIEFKPNTDRKKKFRTKDHIKFVGSGIPKGFDFIDGEFDSGYFFGSHDHRYSTEFIYVIEGKVRISICNNTPEGCMNCGDNCALKSPKGKKNIVQFVLKPKDSIFIPTGKFHTFEALEKSRCITITVPPISRGLL
jgi:quercetin dioxygenase-like cupin family protein